MSAKQNHPPSLTTVSEPNRHNTAARTDACPLCIDLDGSLIHTDLLWESLIKFIKHYPLQLFNIVLWLLQGKATLKQKLAERVAIDVSLLPYNHDVIQYLRDQQTQRRLILVTGSHRRYAQAVADELKLFDEVLATDAGRNLTGNNKAALLAERFGEQGFDYLGNDFRDLKVWPHARHALVVAKPGAFLRKVRQRYTVEQEFPLPALKAGTYLKAIRLHQWVKNLLIIIPFFLSGISASLPALVNLGLCFLSFSLLASATYIINDLLDLESDRSNPRKCKRPFASGKLSIPTAFLMVGVLLLGVAAISPLVPAEFFWVLAMYVPATLSYSFYFKRQEMLDVCVLASLYSLRIIAGIIAAGSDWSFWLLAFSMFFFLSLALGKRVSELTLAQQSANQKPAGRGYFVSDVHMLTSAGIAAGYISVLVIALFINNEMLVENYLFPELLWLICPILLYWISRFWILTYRGQMHEDPVLYAARDRISLLLFLCCVIVQICAYNLPGFI